MRFLASLFAFWLALAPVVAEGVSTPGVPHSIGMTGLQGPAVKYPPGAGGGGGSSYAGGPGDTIPGAKAWVGLRAYSVATAGGTTRSVNLRRASDNTSCDFDIATTGALGNSDAGCSLGGGLTLAAFATQDATASCTIATTTATCTGASSTPHVGSTIVGTGVSQPCYASAVGTFTSGAGTVTLAGGLGVGSAPCGTVGSATTLTFTYGLYTTKAYDQSGTTSCTTACDLSQATAAKQPQLLPSCINGLPCWSFVAAGSQVLSSPALTPVTTLLTHSVVAVRTASFTTTQRIVSSGSISVSDNFSASANNVQSQQGGALSQAAADSAWHAFQFIFAAAATSNINVDGVPGTAATAGSGSWGVAAITLGFSSTFPPNMYLTENGIWGSAFSNANATSMCHNQFGYWGTSTSC